MKREHRPSLSWYQKFAVAFRGIYLAARYERSCWVHLTATAVIAGFGAALHVSELEWCLLILCVTVVWACELLNTALERLVELVEPKQDPRVAAALDVAAGAVLVASIGAAMVGILILLPKIAGYLQSS